ncbi:MAG: DUF1127 domain-containing protein [Pseudomonadota bacterium]
MSFSTLTRSTPVMGTANLDFVSVLKLWLTVHAERRALRELSDAQLADIGVDPKAARREARRPFWDINRRT